jgi:hypothetical protein
MPNEDKQFLEQKNTVFEQSIAISTGFRCAGQDHRYHLPGNSLSVVRTGAVAVRNSLAIFSLGRNLDKRRFDICNPQTGAWFRGVHPVDVLNAKTLP